jgi:hypothetical protein
MCGSGARSRGPVIASDSDFAAALSRRSGKHDEKGPGMEDLLSGRLPRWVRRARILSESDAVLRGSRLPDIALSDHVLSPAAWELLADIDGLQADLAGSRTWDPGAGGSRIQMADLAARLSARASRLGLVEIAERLRDLGQDIAAYD